MNLLLLMTNLKLPNYYRQSNGASIPPNRSGVASAGATGHHQDNQQEGLLHSKRQNATEIGFLLSGFCRLFYDKDSEEWTTYFFFENNLVAACQGCLTREPSTFSIQALEDVELLYFSFQTLTGFYAQFPVYETFGRKLAEYLFMGLDVRLAEQLTLSPEERYLKLLGSPAKRKIIERPPGSV
ncbi:hypothetical protein BH09BAC4_BH09BAC4_42850 [soil metagenome]